MLRSGARLIAATMAAAAMVAAGAGAAQASIMLNASSPFTAGDTVTVTGTAPTFSPAATSFAVAACNTSSANPAVWATRCNGSTATPQRYQGITALGAGGSLSATITLDDAWTDVDFSGGPPPGTSTECATIGADDCSVVVSYYRVSGGVPTFLGLENVAITF